MDDRPQLRMRHWLREPPMPERPLASGYRLREAGRDDAGALADVLTAAFDMPWDVCRVFEQLFDDPQVVATYVVEMEGMVAATASYQLQPKDFPASGWLHWVATHPGHAGQGLGTALTLRVLDRCRRAGHADVGLTTDDERLPAIATYLKCGFEPDPWHPSHAGRWALVLRALSERGRRGPG